MCYYYSIGDILELQKWYHTKNVQLTLFDNPGLKNGFSHPIMPVICDDTGYLIPMSWGLIPTWAKDDIDKIRKGTLNARAETIFEKASFKASIISRRCLVPASYFVEWQHIGDEKHPYKIYLKDSPFFSFGGIYSEWLNKDTKQIMQTFSIITTDANPLMEEIHNTKKRMPLILSKEGEKLWMSQIAKPLLQDLMRPFPETFMVAEKMTQNIFVSDD